MSSGNAAGGGRGRRAKVDRLIDEYGMDGIGEELIESWTRQGSNRRSLRDLAAYFNRELLREALERHGVTSVSMNAERIYRHLQNEEASPGARTRIHRQLEREGVDVPSLTDEFVSHAAIRTFFRNRDVTRPEKDVDQASVEANHVQQLQNRTAVVTEDKVDTLRSTDRLAIGDFQVFVDVQVFCEDCQRQFDVSELLEVGHCSCQSSS
jgi:hypothetical protein